MRKLKAYKPTRFKAAGSSYNQSAADAAVAFIECLRHTKGEWYGQNFALIDWQEQIIRDVFGIQKANGYRQFNTAYIEIPKKQGKQLALDTPVPTPDGWATMGSLQIGDQVFDPQGKPCTVMALSEIDDTEQAYRIVFRDGGSVVAGERHLWNVQLVRQGFREAEITTGELYRDLIAYRKRNAGKPDECRSLIRIPVCGQLDLPGKKLPVDPYLYGFWLGNGCSTKPEITVRTCDVPKILELIPYPIQNQYVQQGGGSSVIRIPALKPILVDSFRDKIIAPTYLRASAAQRWALLQGLVDSDGSIGLRKAQSVYVSTVRQLAESVRELLWSLGIKNAMREEPSTRNGIPTGETLYVIRFTSFDDQPTTRLDRKAVRRQQRQRLTRSGFHYVADIVPLDKPVPMRCIQVSSPSHQYLVGRSFVATHNSELAAAVALLLTCGDYEHGGEVYGCASDRQQASIVFDVAVEMVEQCPALKQRIKPVLSQKRLIYRPLNSFYQVLSAEAYTKHGLNVHGVVFDELHAQPNRSLFDVMTHGSGDARKQPLYFLITTAGNDPHSICWEQHQKATDILDARKIDPTFYPVIYGAKENEDWTSPKVWKKANPSLGITVEIEKLEAACQSARQNPAEENLFRQLRLNQWVKQSVRWMQMEKWDACAFPVIPEKLRGRKCYAGLDLASTTDITALVLVFPPDDDEEQYQFLPFFWIPEENLELRVRRDHVPYDVWEKQGFLKTTEGNVVHYGFIEAFIEELGTMYNIVEIGFDRWGATQMVQNLEGLGFTVVPFGQGFKDMSPPTKELMRLTLDGKIAHAGHPVLRWMMDNVLVRTDPAGNIKVDKEKSTEKIDGVVAAIMGLDRALRNQGGGTSVYDSRGIFIL